MKEILFKSLKILPTDYEEYGGDIKRWKDPSLNYPDCSSGCKFFVELKNPLGFDWGVCANPNGPRKGLLTWEHQAGFGCFESEPITEEKNFDNPVGNIIQELTNHFNNKTKLSAGCDLSDIGNEIGIVIGKHINEKNLGYELESFIAGIKHGISLIDGTH